ncbi:MAG: hypothetical protein AB8H79_24750 [Myxococcota bacterium]
MVAEPHPSNGSERREDASSQATGMQRRARGLTLARRIDITQSLARQLSRRLKRSDTKGRKKARSRLSGLYSLLDALQIDVIRCGVVPSAEPAAYETLDAVDAALNQGLKHSSLKKRHLKRIRADVKAAQTRVEMLLAD